MSNFFKALLNKPDTIPKNPAEYRLYYDINTGEPIEYSMMELTGEFIVIDKETFVLGKMGVQVINEKLHKKVYSVVYKLIPNDSNGTPCCENDVSIIDPNSNNFWGNKVKSEEI